MLQRLLLLPLYLWLATPLGCGFALGGNPTHELTVSADAFDFGQVSVGGSAALTGTLTAAQGSVTLTGLTLAGAGFELEGPTLPLALAEGQSQSFTLRARPQSSGALTGSLAVTSDASIPSLTLPVTANGIHTARVYPPPPGEPPSPHYEVAVIDESGVAQAVFVYTNSARQVATPGNHGTELQTGRSFNWSTFELDAPTRVQVRSVAGFSSVVVRPTRLGKAVTTLDANTIELLLYPGEKVSVEFDTAMAPCSYGLSTCVRDILALFADPKESTSPIAAYSEDDIYRPAPGTYATDATISGITAPVVSTLGSANGKKVVVFGPGVYAIGYWKVPNSVEHIHIEGGAIVYGALDVLPLGNAPAPDDYLQFPLLQLRPQFRLSGHGVLSGRSIPWHMTMDYGYCADDVCGWWKMVRLFRTAVTELTVDDVTFADSPYWTIATTNDGDQRATATMRGFKVLAQWAYNNDGTRAFTNGRIESCFLQANDDTIVLNASGSRVDNCIVWQFSNGGNLQLGWYAKSISNIQVSRLDVIHSEQWWGNGNNSGLLSFAPGSGPGLISNVTISDVHMEGPTLRLVGLSPDGGQVIENLSFTGVSIDAWGNDIYDSGRFNALEATAGAEIRNLTFNTLRVAGQTMSQADYPGTRFQVVGNVSNVVFNP